MDKQITKILAGDVVMFFKFKFNLKPWQNINNDKYFYYNKKKHYARNCNKQKSEKRDINSQKVNQTHWQKTWED